MYPPKHFRSALLFISIASFLFAEAQKPAPVASYQWIKGDGYVQSKNYYLLTLLEELPDAKKMIMSDSGLVQLARAKNTSIANSLTQCDRDAFCYTDRMKFSEEEIKNIGERLTALYKTDNALGRLVSKHLIPSGAYVLFQDMNAQEMLVKAWEQDAKGINFVIGVYGEGKKANYPLIDSTSFEVRGRNYAGLTYNLASLLSIENKYNALFFQVPLCASLHLLEMNERNMAADYEPMTAGENKAAIEKIKTVNWKSFAYSVILVPGAGPDDPKVALSAEGMMRCRLAAIQYKNHDAPFIVVSGGKAHPYKTKFCEAMEMKKFLVENLHIPASAIIIDPHARHTTTNMRNTVRMMFRYGIPFDKPGVTCTTRGQSTMIGMTLIERCIRELGEAPYKNGKRLSETAIEFYPLIQALHITPSEPMDP